MKKPTTISKESVTGSSSNFGCTGTGGDRGWLEEEVDQALGCRSTSVRKTAVGIATEPKPVA